jgi:hypothetical protein
MEHRSLISSRFCRGRLTGDGPVELAVTNIVAQHRVQPAAIRIAPPGD